MKKLLVSLLALLPISILSVSATTTTPTASNDTAFVYLSTSPWWVDLGALLLVAVVLFGIVRLFYRILQPKFKTKEEKRLRKK